jgi:maltooligosyltrehalose trehalohydrolase
MIDTGAVHILESLNELAKDLAKQSGRLFHLIAESDLNSPRVLNSPDKGGYGFTAQWLDDFHHALYVLLDTNGQPRYEDFGTMAQLVKAFNEGFVLSGDYVKFRKRKYGASSAGIPGDRFVVFNQNHDQIGNRPNGDRLSTLIDFDRQKIAVAAMILSPYVPMFFMGEEYAEENPFYYFVSHRDPHLIEAVREGRKKEFANYGGMVDAKDPQDERTFLDSKLQWDKRNTGKHQVMNRWVKDLLTLRKENPVFRTVEKNSLYAYELQKGCMVLHRHAEQNLTELICVFNLEQEEIVYTLPSHGAHWKMLLNSTAYPGNGNVTAPADDLTNSNEIIVPPQAVIVVGRA